MDDKRFYVTDEGGITMTWTEIHIRHSGRGRRGYPNPMNGYTYPTLCGQYVPHHKLQHQQQEHDRINVMQSTPPTCDGCILMLCDEGSYG